MWAAETTSRSELYSNVSWPQPLAIVLGNELIGVDTQEQIHTTRRCVCACMRVSIDGYGCVGGVFRLVGGGGWGLGGYVYRRVSLNLTPPCITGSVLDAAGLICRSTHPPAHICLSIDPSIHPSIYLSTHRFAHVRLSISIINYQVQDTCDKLVMLPCYGVKNSLNVATACSVLLWEALRQWDE